MGKIEQGVIRWPNALRRRAFRAILQVPKDSELGFINARARSRRAVVKLDDVKRRKLFETTTAGVGALVFGEWMAELLGGDEPPPIPHRVGASDIEQIRDAKRVFDSWHRTYGGGVARQAVMGELRWSAGLLKVSCPEQLRPELVSAVGNLAQTAAFMALDADAPEQARRVYRFALGCAEQAEDGNLRAYVLAKMAEQAMCTGQPDEALTPANDPCCYTAARHDYLTGQALADLAILGHKAGTATDRLETAAAGLASVRSRAICLTKLASLTMATGDPLQAAAIGHQALDITGSIRSHLTAEELRELSRYATTHQDLEEVEHLRHRIAALMCTGNPSRNPPSTIV